VSAEKSLLLQEVVPEVFLWMHILRDCSHPCFFPALHHNVRFNDYRLIARKNLPRHWRV
jgi:hypothetical protein